MSFYPIQLFLNNESDQYNISQYCIDIYHNGKNVFSYKKGISFFENILSRKQFIINQKIIACLSLIMLSVTDKASLDDNIKKHISDFQGDEKLEDLICDYLETAESRNEIKYFDLISKIVKKLARCSFEEYAKLHIINPLKMRSTTFDSQGLITNANDYLKLCYNICYQGVFLSKHVNLKNSIMALSEVLNKSQNNYFSYTDRNGVYTLIDTNRKIIAIYTQTPSNISTNQLVIFEKLETLINESFRNESFPKGYNLFP